MIHMRPQTPPTVNRGSPADDRGRLANHVVQGLPRHVRRGEAHRQDVFCEVDGPVQLQERHVVVEAVGDEFGVRPDGQDPGGRGRWCGEEGGGLGLASLNLPEFTLIYLALLPLGCS